MKRKFKTKLLHLLVVISTMISTVVAGIPVQAEPMSESSIVETQDNIEEAKILREKIDSLIGENAITKASYKTDYWGSVTVRYTHNGGYHTIYGHTARIAVAFKPLDGNSALRAYLNLYSRSSGVKGSWNVPFNQNSVDADGYYMFVSDWISVDYLSQHYLDYTIGTIGSGSFENDNRVAHFHVWIDYM